MGVFPIGGELVAVSLGGAPTPSPLVLDEPDPTLVRHLHDLHALREHYDMRYASTTIRPRSSPWRARSSQGHQFTSLLGGAGQGYRDPCHRTPQLVYSTDASYLILYINAIRH
jgi:hypothetical protein